MALILCILPDVASYLFKDYKNFFESFRTDIIFILNILKENNSEQNGGVMVLLLCILSDKA